MNNRENTTSAESIKTIDTNTEEIPKPIELSKEEQVSEISESIELNQQKIANRTGGAQDTKNRINELLGELDLPATEEDPPSVISSRSGLEKLTKETEQLEKQRIELLESEEAPTAISKEVSAEAKEDDKKEGENKEVLEKEINKEEKEKDQEKDLVKKEKQKEKISEGTLAKLSEAIKIKNELALRVGDLKGSPIFKEFERASQELEAKRKRLEGLKNPSSSNQASGGGSMSMSGNTSINLEGNMKIEMDANKEEKEVNLESEALILIRKTENDILKLKKEEIEFGPEGVSVKNGELDVESRKVDAELDIWSGGGMDQKTFSENMQKISSGEGASADIKDKEKFIKFRDVENEAQVYKEKNIGFYRIIEDMQSEIDKNDAEDLECPNEGEVLQILGDYEKGIKNTDKEKGEKEPELKPEPETAPEKENESELEKTDTNDNEIEKETP